MQEGELVMKYLFDAQAMIYPAWVDLYQTEPAIKEYLNRIIDLRNRRSKINSRMPHIHLDRTFWDHYRLYISIRRAEEGRIDLPFGQAYQAHKALITVFTPVAHRSFWARWLYLERAFELASLSGDLLTGAICLRTMIEDVWALLELARFEEQLNTTPTTITEDDFRRVRRHGDLLFKRFLPPLDAVSELPESESPRPFGYYDNLKRAYQALNDYVHPNYGSHLLALFPERTRALTILMDAYITVYDAFLQIPWVYDPVDAPCSELPSIELRSWEEEGRFLVENIFPLIQQHRAERNLASRNDAPAPALKNWLSRPGEPELDHAWQTVQDWFEHLRPLAEFIVRDHSKSERELCDAIMTTKTLGLPMRTGELMQLASARERAQKLQDIFLEGRPSSENDLIRWFDFFERALGLLLTTTQYKIALMSWACIRQLNDQNPVGAILCMRSVIEHYAIGVYLGKRLQGIWKEVEKRGSSGKLPVDRLIGLEEEIARFLAGTKGTDEEVTKWKEEWSSLDLDRALNLRAATDKGLAEDELGFLYKFGSRVIHGERARGVELCPPNDTVYRTANLSRALLALDILASIERILDVIIGGAIILRKMESLAQALAKSGADHEKIIRLALTATNRLVHGRHYTGRGTIDDPFTFADGIDYYDAFYQLCRELALDVDQRKLVRAPHGRFLDEVPDKSGTLFYFATPTYKKFMSD